MRGSSSTGLIEYWWCDTLFMSPPAFIKLANITGDRKYQVFAHQSWMETYELLYDLEEPALLS